MKSPFTDKDMKMVKEWRTMKFRKEEFQVLFHAYKCLDTGEQFEDQRFAELNYNQLINQYRSRHNIPFQEQIISTRKKYNLSATKMSEILGFGVNGYRQYEDGEIPNQSNSNLILLANDPHEFRKLVNLNSSLDSKFKEKTFRTIDALNHKEKENKLQKILERYLFNNCSPNHLTGYKTPNIEKLTEMVVFFSEKLSPWKTKLNKLLFYSDYHMYQQYGFSMSGSQYQAIPMGPVPYKYHSLFDYMVENGDVTIYYSQFENGGIGEQFKPNENRTFNKDLFTEPELEVLEFVLKRFKNTSTDEIIDISHQEKAWRENKDQRSLIDYVYSFDLKL